MSKTFTFAAEVQAPKNDGLYWVQALRAGHWNYPDPEDFENGFDLDAPTLREMKKNFDAAEKGLEVPLRDRTHEREKADCGWVKKVELRNNDTELWAGFEITEPDVKDLVDRKTLKYASSEIDLAWMNPEACRTNGDCNPRKVFEALALVNHPYLKNMAPVEVPINLSEDFGVQPTNSPGTARRSCSCREHGNHKGGNMPELADVQKELDSLKALLEETRKEAGGSKTTLSETEKKLQDRIDSLQLSVVQTNQSLQVEKFTDELKKLASKRKLTLPVYNKALRLGVFLIRTGNAIVLAQEDRPIKLSEKEGAQLGEGKTEESLDKLDVIGEVVDMLGQLPDAISSRKEDLANLEEDCAPDMDQKSDNEKLMAEVEKRRKSDPAGFGKKDRAMQFAEVAEELGMAKGRGHKPNKGGQ